MPFLSGLVGVNLKQTHGAGFPGVFRCLTPSCFRKNEAIWCLWGAFGSDFPVLGVGLFLGSFDAFIRDQRRGWGWEFHWWVLREEDEFGSANSCQEFPWEGWGLFLEFLTTGKNQFLGNVWAWSENPGKFVSVGKGKGCARSLQGKFVWTGIPQILCARASPPSQGTILSPNPTESHWIPSNPTQNPIQSYPIPLDFQEKQIWEDFQGAAAVLFLL